MDFTTVLLAVVIGSLIGSLAALNVMEWRDRRRAGEPKWNPHDEDDTTGWG